MFFCIGIDRIQNISEYCVSLRSENGLYILFKAHCAVGENDLFSFEVLYNCKNGSYIHILITYVGWRNKNIKSLKVNGVINLI